MSNYFQNFPVVPYRFGNNELPVQFQHLGTYIDIIDQVKEYRTFYQLYDIQSGWRPDQVSYDLYGDPNFGWTFFLLNDKLRISGWPTNNARLFPLAKKYYPNITIATLGTAVPTDTGEPRPLSRAETVKPGFWGYFPASKRAAPILKVELDLGQVVFGLDQLVEDQEFVTVTAAVGKVVEDTNGAYVPSESIVQDDRERFETVFNFEVYYQYDSPHHYENADGNWIYPEYESEEPYQFLWDTVTADQSVSYFQRMVTKNDELRNIQVIKPDTIRQISQEFNKLLRDF